MPKRIPRPGNLVIALKARRNAGFAARFVYGTVSFMEYGGRLTGRHESRAFRGGLTVEASHLGEQHHVADGALAGEQHHQPVYADAEAAGGGHSVLHGG